MVGITGIYPYIPRHRMKVSTIDQAWNRTGKKEERSVANFDEDTITMAVNTVASIQSEWSDLHSLYFATTSSPLQEGSPSSLITYILGASAECRTVDLNQSLRSSTIGLRMALEQASQAEIDFKALVVASDQRKGKKGSELERLLGDAACTVEIGKKKVIAQFIDSAAVHDFSYDTWQNAQEGHLEQADGKFSSELKGQMLVQAGRDLLAKAPISSSDIQWVAVSVDQPRLAQIVSKKLDLPASSLNHSLLSSSIGFTGVTSPFLQLNEILLKAKQGDKVMMLHYGSGADAYLFEITEGIESFQKKNDLSEQIKEQSPIEHYQEYLLRRRVEEKEGLAPYSTPVYVKRESENNLRLRAQKCTVCETVVFPKRSNCLACRSKESLEWIWLERTGRIFTYTHDHLFPAEIQPMTMVVIDLDGGGRLFVQMTDYDPEKVRMGDRVSLSFRRIHDGGGFPNYYWKAVPFIRGGVRI